MLCISGKKNNVHFAKLAIALYSQKMNEIHSTNLRLETISKDISHHCGKAIMENKIVVNKLWMLIANE